MSRLVFPADQLERLRSYLLSYEHETCAVVFGRSVEIGGVLERIVARETVFFERSDYQNRSPSRAELRPEAVAQVAQRARQTGESLVFVHTHPFPLNQFSATDDAGELALREFLAHRAPLARHGALLLTPEVSIARELGKGTALTVSGIGPQIEAGNATWPDATDYRFDRQVRAFGAAGQALLRSMRVAIVGLGGTGSVVLQQLAHLGVRDFILLDPDTVEETNLNRLVGAGFNDVGSMKVEVAERLARRIDPGSSISSRGESVLQARVARSLAAADFVFACTDSHGSRAVLNQVAYQYLVPTIDMGVAILSSAGSVSHVTGRTQLLSPGLACLTCSRTLDPEQIRRDLLTDFQRQADPYIPGAEEPAPSVISLNSTVASFAVTMFLSTALGTGSKARLVNYDGISGAARPAKCNPHPSCVVCSRSGALARADEWPLAARHDEK